jgi:hypothetical protein
MLCRVALVRTHVSEEFSASFIRVTTIGELGHYVSGAGYVYFFRCKVTWEGILPVWVRYTELSCMCEQSSDLDCAALSNEAGFFPLLIIPQDENRFIFRNI